MIPGRDKIWFWSNLIVGIEIPRAYFRKLSKKKLEELVKWIHNQWMLANDNNVEVINKPSWLPKKYPRTWEKSRYK